MTEGCHEFVDLIDTSAEGEHMTSVLLSHFRCGFEDLLVNQPFDLVLEIRFLAMPEHLLYRVHAT